MRSVRSRSLVGAVVLSAFVTFAASARADGPTKDQCIAANESAQSLRQAGKLQATRAQLRICIADSCPGPVRDDCTERLNDVERAIPTVVFDAKGPDGQDLSAVRVTMDGAALVDRLDGVGIALEPGEHSFEFAAEGYVTVAKTLIVREGVKGRAEVITFARPPSPGAGAAAAGVSALPPPAPLPAPGPVVTPSGNADAAGSGAAGAGASDIAGGAGHRGGSGSLGLSIVGFSVAGLGLIVGAVTGLQSLSTVSDLKSAGCNASQPCSSDLASKGADAKTQGNISTAAFILAGGGLLLGILMIPRSASPSQPASVSLRVGPGSIGASGSF